MAANSNVSFIDRNLPTITQQMGSDILKRKNLFGLFYYGDRLLEMRGECEHQGVEGTTYLCYDFNKSNGRPLAVAKMVDESSSRLVSFLCICFNVTY